MGEEESCNMAYRNIPVWNQGSSVYGLSSSEFKRVANVTHVEGALHAVSFGEKESIPLMSPVDCCQTDVWKHFHVHHEGPGDAIKPCGLDAGPFCTKLSR